MSRQHQSEALTLSLQLEHVGAGQSALTATHLSFEHNLFLIPKGFKSPDAPKSYNQAQAPRRRELFRILRTNANLFVVHRLLGLQGSWQGRQCPTGLKRPSHASERNWYQSKTNCNVGLCLCFLPAFDEVDQIILRLEKNVERNSLRPLASRNAYTHAHFQARSRP